MHTTCFGHSWGGFAKSGRFSCTTASCERGCMTHGGDRTGAMLQFFFPQCFTSWRQTCFIVISLLWWERAYISRNVPLIAYLYFIYTRDICMFPPPITQIGQVQRRHFRENQERIHQIRWLSFSNPKRCPTNATHPENKYMAFIKGLYEGSWWLRILSRSQPQCHWGTAILETYLGFSFDHFRDFLFPKFP